MKITFKNGEKIQVTQEQANKIVKSIEEGNVKFKLSNDYDNTTMYIILPEIQSITPN